MGVLKFFLKMGVRWEKDGQYLEGIQAEVSGVVQVTANRQLFKNTLVFYFINSILIKRKSI